MPRLLSLAAALLLIAAITAAHAERRVALVIGNADYQYAAPLANPVHDADGMEAALNRLGFEVMVARNADRAGLERALRDFGRRLEGASVALLFYAGHGVQLDGENWLVPVDARVATERDMAFETVRLSLALAQMEDGDRTSIVILDACRENPFRSRVASGRAIGTQGGLATVDAGLGTLIVYSTQPNAVAMDGPADGNSPFTTALLRRIETPDIELRRMLTLVRADVVQATSRRQVPWDHSALMGDFFFRPAAAAAPPPAIAAPAAAVAAAPARAAPPALPAAATPAASAPPAPPAALPPLGEAAALRRTAPELADGVALTGAQRVQLQRALANLGFDQDGRSIGPAWGIHPGAIRRFQAARGETANGRLTEAQAAWLLARPEGAQPDAREAELALPFLQFAQAHARWFFNPFWQAMREHARAAGQADCRGRGCIRAVQEKFGQPATGVATQALIDAMAAAPIVRTETRGQVRPAGDWRLRPQAADGTCTIETAASAIAGRSLDPLGARAALEARGGIVGQFARIVDFDPAASPAVAVGRQRFPLLATVSGQWLVQAMLAGKPDGSFASDTHLFRALAAAQEFSVTGTSRWGGPLSITFSARGFAEALQQLDGCARGDLRWALKPTTPESAPVPLTQAAAANAPRPAADLAQGATLTGSQRLQVMRALHGLGFQAEGFADPWRLFRVQAILDYQKSRRATPTGRLAQAEATALMATPQARQPSAWEAEGANPLVRLSTWYELFWNTDPLPATQARAYTAALGLARDCSWRDCLGLIQQHFNLRQTRMLDDATFRAMGAAPRASDPGGAERFGDWRFTPAERGGECVLAAAPRRIEGTSHWTPSRIEFRRNPDVGRTVLVQRLASFVDFSPDEPPVMEAAGARIALEPSWGSPWFRGESTGISGDGWTQSNAALRALAVGGEVAIAGRSRWGGALRLVYSADGFAAAFARLDEACGGGALAAAYINAPSRGRGR